MSAVFQAQHQMYFMYWHFFILVKGSYLQVRKLSNRLEILCKMEQIWTKYFGSALLTTERRMFVLTNVGSTFGCVFRRQVVKWCEYLPRLPPPPPPLLFCTQASVLICVDFNKMKTRTANASMDCTWVWLWFGSKNFPCRNWL